MQRQPYRIDWPWRIVALLAALLVPIVAITLYADLADAPIVTSRYTDDGRRIVDWQPTDRGHISPTYQSSHTHAST